MHGDDHGDGPTFDAVGHTVLAAEDGPDEGNTLVTDRIAGDGGTELTTVDPDH